MSVSKRFAALRLAGASAIALAFAGAGLAQEVNADLEPNYGAFEIDADDVATVREFKMIAGGPVPAEYAASEACSGFVTTQPDFLIDWDPNSDGFLRFYAMSASDTTLVVQDPSGDFHCDDDSYNNMNPRIDFQDSEAGEYAVWVGVFYPEERPGTAFGITSDPTSTPGGSIDPDGEPEFAVELQSGFMPDPEQFEVFVGGPVDSSAAIGGRCAGFVSSAPNVVLDWDSADEGFLRIFAESEGDTTLIVNAPDGEWYCDDDGHYALNPRVDFDEAESGRYAIWIGSFYQDEGLNATLNITETDLISADHQLDLEGAPTAGEHELSVGEELSIDVEAGGSFDLDAAIGNGLCYGYTTSTPTARIQYDAADAEQLVFTLESDGDTVMAVNDSNGDWHCNDDSLDSLNAQVILPNAEGGQFDVFVGTFGDYETFDAVLNVTTGDLPMPTEE